jgi:aspartate 1-decarboxylase
MPLERELLKSKIHRATVTEADVHYIGSISIDEDLMERADLRPGEKVAVWNVSNRERLRNVNRGGMSSGVGIKATHVPSTNVVEVQSLSPKNGKLDTNSPSIT